MQAVKTAVEEIGLTEDDFGRGCLRQGGPGRPLAENRRVKKGPNKQWFGREGFRERVSQGTVPGSSWEGVELGKELDLAGGRWPEGELPQVHLWSQSSSHSEKDCSCFVLGRKEGAG